MALEDDIRTLSGVALLQSLGREPLRLMAFGADHISLTTGQRLFREGDLADSAFVITSGRIDLFHQRGQERIDSGSASKGDVLNELALIAESRRLSDAVAAVRSDVMRLDRKDFMRVLQEYPELAQRLYDRIADDLQRLSDSLEPFAGRLAD